MSKKYIREVKKTQNKNIQTNTHTHTHTHTTHTHTHTQKEDNTKNLRDLTFDLRPENFNNKYELMKNGVECRGILTKIQINTNGKSLVTKLVVA